MLELNFTPVPELYTDRLIIRRLEETDAADLFILRSDPDIMRYIPRPLAVSITDVTDFIRRINELTAANELINWGIALKEDNRIIGTIGFVRLSKENHRGEVGYMLQKEQQGQGILREALLRVLDYGFTDLCFHSIAAVVDPANMASIRLLERAGFHKEAHFREDCYYNGQFLDSVHYSLLTPHRPAL